MTAAMATGPRTLWFGPEAVAVLAALPRRDGAARVFPEDLTAARLYAFWVEVREEAGLRGVRLHDARHTYASQGVMNGVALTVVGKLLGHRKCATTAIYAHLDDAALRDAVAQAAAVIFRAMGYRAEPRPLPGEANRGINGNQNAGGRPNAASQAERCGRAACLPLEQGEIGRFVACGDRNPARRDIRRGSDPHFGATAHGMGIGQDMALSTDPEAGPGRDRSHPAARLADACTSVSRCADGADGDNERGRQTIRQTAVGRQPDVSPCISGRPKRSRYPVGLRTRAAAPFPFCGADRHRRIGVSSHRVHEIGNTILQSRSPCLVEFKEPGHVTREVAKKVFLTVVPPGFIVRILGLDPFRWKRRLHLADDTVQQVAILVSDSIADDIIGEDWRQATGCPPNTK